MCNIFSISRQSRTCLLAVRPLLQRSTTYSRNIHISFSKRNSPSTISQSPPSPSLSLNWKHDEKAEYVGPSNTVIRIHKTVHMSVLAGFIISLPYHLHAISAFPLSFQATVLGTGTALYGIVTLYIVLSTGPYVAYLRWLPHDGRKKPQGIEMTTHTLFMRERITRVYNPAFLVDADKPFTVWKLARNFRLPPFVANIVKVGDEEVVAETFDKSGKVIGRWVVTWGEGGVGVCRSEGKMQRYFSVHQELLPRAIQWGPH